jgi:hypothetical protein
MHQKTDTSDGKTWLRAPLKAVDPAVKKAWGVASLFPLGLTPRNGKVARHAGIALRQDVETIRR